MKSIILALNSIVIFITLSLFTQTSANAEIKNYTIGVLSLTKKEQTLKKWSKTAEHLSNKFDDANFTIIPMTYDEINDAMKKAKIDFLLTNPAHYIIHEKEVELFRLATVVYSKKSNDLSSFGGVIVTLKDNNNINTIDDIANKKIAAVKKGSLGGYQAQLKEMLDNDISLPNLQQVIFTDMPHSKTLDLLLDKKVDVAFLRSGVLEKLSNKKEIDIEKLKIINQKNPHYPFITSTRLYPEWPFAALSHIDNETKKRVAEILFNIKQTDQAAIYGNYKSWYIPLDYNIVTELLQELRLPPFDKVSNFTIKDIIYKYTTLFILFSTIGILVTIYLFIINIKLYRNRKELEKLNNNLNQIVEEKVKELRKKDQALLEQSKMASMGEMIGNIAHQWRQPLSVITTCSTGIQLEKQMNTINDEKLDHLLNLINEQSQYLSQTIETFQNFIKDDKKSIDAILQDRIDNALSIVSAALKNHHIKLINEIDYLIPIHINIIPGELSQVIINIINNAKDILLDNHIEKPWIKINTTLEKEKVTITIEDNAGGVPKDVQPKIFDPYFTTKHKSQGTGLGLNISYKIITESLNGRIWEENTSNGAKFFIELPIKH